VSKACSTCWLWQATGEGGGGRVRLGCAQRVMMQREGGWQGGLDGGFEVCVAPC
jgi:hypothetical protein